VEKMMMAELRGYILLLDEEKDALEYPCTGRYMIFSRRLLLSLGGSIFVPSYSNQEFPKRASKCK
jgi:hypothetical protein